MARALGRADIDAYVTDVLTRVDVASTIDITDLPLRIRPRPVVADASATHGVGRVSLPALGAVQLRRRASDAVLRLVDGLLGEGVEASGRDAGHRLRVGRRLAEIAARELRVVPEED